MGVDGRFSTSSVAAGVKCLSDLPVALGFHLSGPTEPIVSQASRRGW